MQAADALVPAALVLTFLGLLGAVLVRTALIRRRLKATLRNGEPRRYRAQVRIFARRALPASRPAFVLCDAEGLFWQARFDRAVAVANQLLAQGCPARLEPFVVALKAEALVF